MTNDSHAAKGPVDQKNSNYCDRPRLDQLFVEAMQYPLVLVVAGTGYGKTWAVNNFLRRHEKFSTWIQLTERDNLASRFWENFAHSVQSVNNDLANAMRALGFPENNDKLHRFISMLQDSEVDRSHILVLDDLHHINNPAILRLLEAFIQNLQPSDSLILISQNIPNINLSSLQARNQVFTVNEDDLRFSTEEVARFFQQQQISVQPSNLLAIMQDTKGWAFAINLLSHSYQRAPGYEGYLRNAVKMNVFQLMESEIWQQISAKLQSFLVSLSLIDQQAIDLINQLAGSDSELLAEMDRQSAYIRRDNDIGAYLIHPLFLEYLRQKQGILTPEQQLETYRITARWCDQNNFRMDALNYYEKIGDYQAIINILFRLPLQIPQDIAEYVLNIFKRAPQEVFDQVELFAVMYIRALMSLGQWSETEQLMDRLEQHYLYGCDNELDFCNHDLGGIYYCRGILRSLLSTMDDNYDFDGYYAKADACLSASPIDIGTLSNHPAGPWISLVGSAAAGAPDNYNAKLTIAVSHVTHCLHGAMSGFDDLARGELEFFQNREREAQANLVLGLERAREAHQFDAMQRALFYLLRMAILHGDLERMDSILAEMTELLEEQNYNQRYATYDIALAWYYCALGLTESVPDWLKENFSPYGHAYYIENFGNQAKARYCYLTRNYAPLLAYIEEMVQRESILYGRVEMLTARACVYSIQHEKAKAIQALETAWQTAAPNNIVTPFIILGKDMRTLTAAALKESNTGIPVEWLLDINRRSASFAKRRSHLLAEYRQAHNLTAKISLSRREAEVLTDLSQGLSRQEIATVHQLSINTIKLIINQLYIKLEAHNLADLIRVAAQNHLI